MKDYDGVVTIPGFYDGVILTEDVKRELDAVPDDEEKIREDLMISSSDKVGSNYQEAIQYPSLNVRGLNSGWVGKEARTIVPDVAVAEIDVRLVKESKPKELLNLIKNHIIDQGCLLYTSPSPRDMRRSRMPSSA